MQLEMYWDVKSQLRNDFTTEIKLLAISESHVEWFISGNAQKMYCLGLDFQNRD